MRDGQLGIALLGTWHVHADDYASQVDAQCHARLVCVWDVDVDRGEKIAQRHGVSFSSDVGALLADERVDAVIVAEAPARKTALILEAIRAGKHVLTEKLLAPTTEDVDVIVATAKTSRVTVNMAMPFANRAPIRAIDAVLADGRLGVVSYLRVRMAIDGLTTGWLPKRFEDPAEALGGAMNDLGCHPVYLIDRFTTEDPIGITASYGRLTKGPLEDNAVVTLRYGDGSLAVAESGHVNSRSTSFSTEIHGTAGSLLFGFEDAAVRVSLDGGPWNHLPAEEDGPTPLEQWIEAIRQGAPTGANLSAARRLTWLIERANRAAENKCDAP